MLIDFRPVSKFNTDSFVLHGNPAGEKHMNTIYSHLQPARIDQFAQSLHGGRGRHAHHNGNSHSIQHIVFATGCKMLIFGHCR